MKKTSFSRALGVVLFVAPLSLVAVACGGGSSGGGGDNDGGSSSGSSGSSSGSSGSSSGSSGTSSGSSGSSGDSGTDANSKYCKLPAVTGSQTVNATFKWLDQDQPPTMTG